VVKTLITYDENSGGSAIILIADIIFFFSHDNRLVVQQFCSTHIFYSNSNIKLGINYNSTKTQFLNFVLFLKYQHSL